MTPRRAGLSLLGLLFILGTPLAAQGGAGERPFTILVSNDDGFDAPGIHALVDSLAPIARVIVAAPREQESGMGHAITFRDPISVAEAQNPFGIRWYAIAAHPATCARLALSALLDTLPDLVVSGINAGDNIGASAWVSGTVAAAMEGPLHGVPGIAVSVGSTAYGDYAYAAGVARRLIEQLRAKRLLQGTLLLNVNVPRGGAAGVHGVRVARMSLQMGDQRYVRTQSPRGAVYYFDSWTPPKADTTPGTDLDWFSRGYVTIVPLLIDQTASGAVTGLASELDSGK